MRQDSQRAPLVRLVAIHSVRLDAKKAKSMEGPTLAMEDMELPPDVALQPVTCATAKATAG